ncbi:MAG: 4Fe-4S binding protein, partial [Magnetococcales bacterium]|nr:4Fe-4S binding protein [Magnetococcales bacterium]
MAEPKQQEAEKPIAIGKGRTPEPAAQAIHAARRSQARERHSPLHQMRGVAKHSGRTHWRNRRWILLILVNLLFVVSYRLDIQVLEGSLSASRFVGFHLADPYAAMQVWLAFGHVIPNLVIGVCTLIALYLLVGGRAFCSWVCPYHLLAEWVEWLRSRIGGKRRDHPFRPELRWLFWVAFLLIALGTGYTVFETLSPVGILSRAMIYGSVTGLGWVGLLLLWELFFTRRGWCRYVCPIGLTYRLVGTFSLVRVRYNLESCQHDGACRQV